MTEPRYPYLHVTVPLGAEPEADSAAELVSQRLFELGAQGIEERDASTLVRSGEPQTTTLVASFEDDATALAAASELEGEYHVRLEHVVGDAWREEWRKYFKPLRVGSRLVIKPSWEPYEAQPNDIVITLDPGQAFGTGTHETTQLVLSALTEHVTPGIQVLDLGTGSGILAIAAVLLGAAHVTAVDVDPLAVSATRENALANGVSRAIAVSDTPVEAIDGQFPLVLANIEARVLVPLAAAIAARVAPGGALLLSGLLHDHVSAVRDAYPDFEQLAAPTAGDWAALLLRKGRA